MTKYEHDQMQVEQKRYCGQCRTWKTDAEYHRNKASRTGFAQVCKPCANQNTKDWIAANRDRHNASQLRWTRKKSEPV